MTPADEAVRQARDYVLRRSTDDVRFAWQHDAKFKHSVDALEQMLMSVACTLDELNVPDTTIWNMAERQFRQHIKLDRDLHRIFAKLTEHYDRNRPRWVGPPLMEPTT